MDLSLSVRVAEAPTKDRLTMPFVDFVQMTTAIGYRYVCMRPSALHAESPPEQRTSYRNALSKMGLIVSMATTDFNVPLNNDQGPGSLRNIGPHLDVAESIGATLIRVCLKTEDDIPAAQQAADEAAPRGIRLAHQCHTNSLFETVDEIVDVLERINRDNFGLIYEPANLMLCGQSYNGDVLDRLRPWLMNVYLQNHHVADDGPEVLPTRTRGKVRYHDLPLWEPGGVDYKAVFRGLESVGYDGTVTVHQQYSCIGDPYETAERCYEFLWMYIAG